MIDDEHLLVTFNEHYNIPGAGLSGKYRGGIYWAVFPGISRPVQYSPGKYFLFQLFYNFSYS